ncbi:hypothetical protein HR11_08560 [Porphyromonas macacae]|uniref:hypothetical protein n=1 Tax=Porphyromonas macacae TaxID=28115 RepID=UPI00052CF36D|nr:hypothetical protein [Porphyromonas macacae]KGN98574.1 hypothetical protein HR11_08560 [Porphyromonas macacae]
MKSIKFEIVKEVDIPWDTLKSCYDHTVFKSKNWSLFLKEYYHILPFVISISENENIIGYFYGQKMKKMGIKIVASPFEGWSTAYQGLSMLAPISIHKRIDIYEALIKWLFDEKLCHLFQVSDFQLEVAECLHRNLNIELLKGYVLDLTLSEEELYSNMSSRAKDPIKKSIKRGVVVKQMTDVNVYAHYYYMQLCDVFKNQGLTPTHSEQQIISMLTNTSPDSMLCLYSESADGEIISTGFYAYDGIYAFYSGAASYKKGQNLCPNEILMWEAIKILKQKGVKYLEFGGGRRYKEKYGPKSFVKPKIIAAKYKWLLGAKQNAKDIYYGLRNTFGRLKGHKINNGLKKS